MLVVGRENLSHPKSLFELPTPSSNVECPVMLKYILLQNILAAVLILLGAGAAYGRRDVGAVAMISAAGGRIAYAGGGAAATAVGVDFRGASVDDGPLQALERLPGLKALDLTGDRISDDALRHVAGLDRLESLVLVGTHVGDEGMRISLPLLACVAWTSRERRSAMPGSLTWLP